MMIPRQPHCLSGIVVTLYFFLLFSFVLPTLASPKLHYCSHDQRDALMEFKHEFPENESNPRFNNLTSWNKSSDCCSWEGVTCDAKSGKVISLFVFAVFLNNSLKPNSGLFKLLYLQNLTLLVCNLHGEIPSSFGNLSHLKYLNLQGNKLRGQIPASIENLTQLRDLGLRENMLSGKIPVSFANLTQLRYLDLSMNQLSGKIPVSFFNLTELFELHLQSNDFEPQLLPDMGRLHNLMGFSGNSFFGPFPRSLFTIPSLEFVELRGNQFKGPIDFGNISLSYRLQILSLADNKLDGPIPESISKFLNLETLDLRNNSFSGPFPTLLLTIPSLQIVKLAGNQFKGPIDFGSTSSSSSSNLRVLDLAHNQFDGQISESISKYLNLVVLDLSNNKLEGEVPCCIRRLESLILSHNSFNSFGKSTEVLDQTQLRELRLDSNSFRGPFPLWICELISLEFLDFSDNTFSGSVPSCLRSTTKYLQVLNLRNNNFSGILPDVFVNATFLSELDISHNRLEGKLPKSLINCIWLGILNVGSNKFKDKFPSWLGSLPSLNVIILRSNQLYGPLYHRNVPIGFQSLKVIDVSHNYFSGTFPTFYFSSWLEMSQMTTVKPEYGDAYMSYYIDMTFGNFDKGSGAYSSSMEMVHKGVDTEFEKIRKDFRAIDFSRNRFYGKIPESIGLLKGLRFLNLSSNAFTRNIPHSLANLTNLEALDVSHNQLSCQIPQDLGELSFLSTMNFAHNNLEGPIPRSTQFQRQNCSSFMDNPKLYGLDDICRKTHVPNPTPQKLEEEQMINWIAMAIAYGPGVFCGLVIGHIFISHKHEWFMERFRRNNPRVVIRSAR